MKQDGLVTTHEETILGHISAIEAQRVPLPHLAIVRAPGLLPMLYRPSELAEELGVSAAVVREWIDKGLPHQRDHRGHLWIDGRQVTEWVKVTRQRPAGRVPNPRGETPCPSVNHLPTTKCRSRAKN